MQIYINPIINSQRKGDRILFTFHFAFDSLWIDKFGINGRLDGAKFATDDQFDLDW